MITNQDTINYTASMKKCYRDSYQNYLVGIIVPDFEALRKADERQIYEN